MANKIKLKRGLSSKVSSITLDEGEIAITTDTNKLYSKKGILNPDLKKLKIQKKQCNNNLRWKRGKNNLCSDNSRWNDRTSCKSWTKWRHIYNDRCWVRGVMINGK